ncbi:hypothetical protein TraAM80_05880 [Trypanosoma rangeli]|uniref:Uncharacterized protein n=1 Tax=Trypanosoma rangeli TaxID=5698 RepID=A0A3R7LTU7_TRYRA|nr:uncharacterized protein TraAM80_05880 [Trypanosoma rangeli]RNF03200.1 hypothetical protein TraAM80_05880 [Trypanosoma rangeli]|eukprot:RNF03200.1 hypothetical protein TraAM80_05880 [Trypanosoma rangeli]
MPTIIIDDLTIRLASELQNTFNPSHAFGCAERGGSLALRESPSGHLLLPFDAEGNVLVTPGRRYQLVLVKERKSFPEPTDRLSVYQQRQDSKQQHKEVEAATPDNNGRHVEGNGTAAEVVEGPNSSAKKKRRGRKHRHENSAAEEILTSAPQQKKERKETPRDDDSEKDDDVPLYRTVGNKQLSGNGATEVSTILATRPGSPESSHAVVDKSPNHHAATLAPSKSPDSDDDDNVPLSKSYAKQQKKHEQQTVEPTAAAVPVNGTKKPPSRRQTKPPRRPPVATPSTSESD